MKKHGWERSKGEERGDWWLDMISAAVCMVSVHHRDTECCKYVGLISVHNMQLNLEIEILKLTSEQKITHKCSYTQILIW